MSSRNRRRRSHSKKPVRTRSSQSRQRRLRYEALEDRRLLALNPLVVTSTLDTVDAEDGVTTLREAITHANSVSGTDAISFNIPTTDPGFVDVDSAIPGGDAAADAFVIHLLSGLPPFDDATGGTTLDGRTQTSFGGDTNPFGPEIVLDGSSGGYIGLQFNSSDNAVIGLNVHSFSGPGIRVTGGTNNWIAGNYVGTDATGTQALGNGGGGIGLNGGSGHVVGSNSDGVDDADEGNLVAGNLQSNIGAYVSNDNTIAGNTIGSDRSGTAIIPGPAVWGVWIGGGASNNVIGGADLAARNIINGPGGGVAITGKVFFSGQEATTGNRVQGNYIGITPDGASALGTAGVGVFITEGATGNIIGTDGDGFGDATEGNVVSGSAQHGILIRGSDGNVVAGNLVGTDALGNVVIGNSQEGVRVGSGAKWNRIGTNGDGVSDTAERNVISGNRYGVYVVNPGSDNNTVAGNYIGTDISGTMKLGNVSRGVWIGSDAQHNVIGTNGDGVGDMAERNIISGNASYGVVISGRAGLNVVAGNYIGTDVTGTQALANFYGVGIAGALSNVIGTNGDGTADAAEGNLISGNTSHGIDVINVGTDHNIIAGNDIGTDVSGTVALANGGHGIRLQNGVQFTRIGTNGDGVADQAERNVISGNTWNGVFLAYGDTRNNVIAGNNIGTNAAGDGGIANGQNGVRVDIGATSNRIGADGDGQSDSDEANRIAFNSFAGVAVTSADAIGNTIRRNSIYSNGRLGIDLSGGAEDAFGTTSNDQGDLDVGPNNLQNLPVLSLVEAYPANRLVGSLNSTADTPFTVDVYANSAVDASGHGEGQRYVSSFTVTTDALGNATIDEWLPSAISLGEFIAVTATDPGGNTSEFSAAVPAVETSNSRSVINQFPPTNGVGPFGQPTTSYFAQSFVAPTGFAESLTFQLDYNSAGPAPLQFHVLLTSTTGTGTDIRPADVLFESETLTLPYGSDPTNFTVNLGSLDLVDGATYAWILDSYAVRGGWSARALIGSRNGYADGHVFYLDAFDGIRGGHFNSDWSDLVSDDLAFRMTFAFENTPSIADVGGPYSIDEGTGFTFDGSASSDVDEPNDALAFAWDFNYDGSTFDVDASGATPTVSFADEFDTRLMALRVTDSEGVQTISTTLLTVNNVSPMLTLESATDVQEGGVTTLTGVITDPGTQDTLTLHVNWGDPQSPNNAETYTFDASATGSQTFTLTHQYPDDRPTGTSQDDFTIRAGVTDGAISTLFESATTGGSGVPRRLAIDSGSFLGVRFEVTAAATASRIGLNQMNGNGEIFGAIVRLSGPEDIPDSANLATGDLMATALIPVGAAQGEYSTDVSVTLGPGWYALIFGSGLFGAGGYGELPGNDTDIGAPSYFFRDGGGNYHNGTDRLRFFVKGLGDSATLGESTTLTVINDAPTVAAQDDASIQGYDGAVISREITFTDAGLLDQHTVTIDYGDGSIPQTIVVPAEERSVILDHAYAVTSGGTSTYQITMDVLDDDSGIGSTSFDVLVTDKALTQPDNRPTIQFQQSSYSVREGQPIGQSVVVTLSSPATEELEIPLLLTDVTAARDADYVLSDTVVTFPAGSSQAVLFFVNLNDLLFEPTDETAVLSLPTSLESVKLGAVSSTTLVIQDDGDLPPQYDFKIPSSRHVEGESFDLTVELTSEVNFDVRVPIITPSVNESDYELSSQEVLIPAGSLSGSVVMTIIDDVVSEPTESVSFRLGASPDGLQPSFRQRGHTVSIDPSDAVLVQFTDTFLDVNESDGHFEVTVELDGPAPDDLVIPLQFDTSYSASDPDDFRGVSSITIPVSQISATVPITLTNDQVAEFTERAYVRFGESLPAGVQLARSGSRVHVQINDDDTTTIQFTARRTSVYEDANAVAITLSTGGVTFDRDIQIPFAVRELSASGHYNGASPDLKGPTGTITIPVDATQGSIFVTPVNDSASPQSEGKEYFDFVLEADALDGIPGAVRGTITTHTVTVLDDDPAATISIPDTTVSEGATVSLKFTVKLTAPTNKKVRIPFDVYGTAKRNLDYTIVEETKTNYKVSRNFVEINAGATSAVIQVKMINDNLIEVAERMGIKLVPKYGTLVLTNALIGGTNADSVVISASDGVPVPTISVVRGKQPGSSSYSSTSTWIREGGSFRVTVTLAKPAFKNVYVPISFPAATGRASSNDFTTSGLSSGKLKIPAGKTSAIFYIYTTDDTRTENDEKIRITMGQPVDSAGKNFGKLPKTYYKFVGINANDQFTATATAGTLQITDGTAGTYSAPTSTSGSSPTPSVDTAPLTGTGFIGLILQGYRDGSTVFLDGNLNGVRDYLDFNGDGIQSEDEPDEPQATTFADGSFVLDVPEAFDRNSNGELDVDEAQIVSIGGIDTSTGLPQETRLVAAPGDYLATPLTTLVAQLVQSHGLTLNEAHVRVLASMSLPDFEMGKVSALRATLAGDVSAASTYPATNALNNAAVVIANYLQGVTGIGVEIWADIVYQQLASIVAQPGATIDLSDAAFLEGLLFDVASQTGIGEFSSRTSTVATALAAINGEMLQLPVVTTMEFLEALVQRKIVARGQMSADAAALGAETLTVTDFALRYSGQALKDRIDAALPGTIEPVRLGVTDARIIEGNDGTSFAEFEVQISDYFNAPISVQYATEDNMATAGSSESGGDYGAVSGILTWNPGDTPSIIVQVPIYGDTLPELDEGFYFQLSDASSGIIQRPIGEGVIRGDDAISIQLSDVTDASEASIIVDRDSILISQDGAVILDGQLSAGAPLEVRTAAGGKTRVEIEFLSTSEGGQNLMLISQGTNDSLHLSNAQVDQTDHFTSEAKSGRFDLNDSVIEYLSFSDVTNEKSPTMTLSAEPAIDQTFLASIEFPDQVNTEDVILNWTLRRNEQAMATGDGAFADFLPVTHGNYDISLRAELIDGSIATVQRSFFVAPLNSPPVADAGGSYQVDEGGSVQLTAAATTDVNLPEDVLDYVWDFDGDGLFGETGTAAMRGDEIGISPTFDASQLDGPTVALVALIVIDSFGESSQAVAAVGIANVAPTPVIDNINPIRVEGTKIDVAASATDPGGANDALTYSYAVFKDGAVTHFASGSGVDLTTFSFTPDDNGFYDIVLTVSDEDGGSALVSQTITVANVDPTAGDVEVDLVENPAPGADVASVTATDPGTDTITYTIIGGSGVAGFAIDPASGAITVSDPALVDYEATTTLTLQVRAADEDGGSDTAIVTVNLLNLASISGVVFVDVNEDGLYQANEPGIDGTVIQLRDSNGNAVLDKVGAAITALTSDGGFYLFEDLDPAEYQLDELQPTGVADGAEILGSLGGTIVGNDTMQLSLARVDAHDYAFAEIGGQVTSGESAAIGFWQNKHGQQLIASAGNALSRWLSDSFGNVFGDSLVGATGEQVAEFYRDQLFFQKSKNSNGPAKVDAQFMATALGVYFSNRNLAGDVGAAYGFSVSDTGLGVRVVNVGSRGDAFGVEEGMSLTIMQLLQATNALTDSDDLLSGFASIYDLNGDGVIDAEEARLRTLSNDLYNWINSQ